MRIDDNQDIEVTIIQDIYKSVITKDKVTQEDYEDYKLVKRNVRSKKTFARHCLHSYEHDISPSGKIYKSKFKIQLAGDDRPLSVVGKYEDFKDIINPKNKIGIGYNFY